MKKLTQITKCFFTSIFLLVNINLVFSQQGVVFTEFSTSESDNKLVFNPPLASNSVIRVADLNNNGKEDFISTSYINNITNIAIYENKGNGQFELKKEIEDSVWLAQIQFVDLKNNGLLDLIISFNDGRIKFMENKGNFSFEHLASDVIDTNRFTFRNIVDLRPSGKLMFLVRKSNQPVKITFENNSFTMEEDFNDFPHLQSNYSYLDISGNGFIDAFTIAYPDAHLYANNGLNVFHHQRNTPFIGTLGQAHFHDITNNGRIDILLTGQHHEGRFFKLYKQVDSMVFQTTNFFAKDYSHHGRFFFEDLDNDGDLDLIYISTSQADLQIFKNDGRGNFTEDKTKYFSRNYGLNYLIFTDLNDDGSKDIIMNIRQITGSNVTEYYLNDGTGKFTRTTSGILFGLEKGDLDMGDLVKNETSGLLISGADDNNNYLTKLYEIDKNSTIREVRGFKFEGLVESAVSFIDINNDNLGDFIVSGETQSGNFVSKLFVQSNDNQFIESSFEIEGLRKSSIAVSDVNKDGNMDFLISGETQDNKPFTKLYINNQDETFTISDSADFIPIMDGAVSFGDVNRDGLADILISGVNEQGELITKLYFNEGDGKFSEDIGNSFQGLRNGSISFGDIERNNAVDIMITGIDEDTISHTLIYRNNGIGSFTLDTHYDLPGVSHSTSRLINLNNNNFVDLFLSGNNHKDGPITSYYLGNNIGKFQQINFTPLNPLKSGSVAFHDINKNGRLDLAMMGRDENDKLITKLYHSSFLPLSVPAKPTIAEMPFKIYPNPAENTLNIEPLGSELHFEVEIISIHGKSIAKYSNTQALDIADLASGIYLIKIIQDGSVWTSRLIKR